VVAEGCVFTDGSVALRWRGNNPATAVWPDLDSILAVHGHHGATEVRWLEPHAEPAAEPRAVDPAEPSSESRSARRPESDLDHLFGATHTVRPPTGIADPSGLPTQHPRGWAAARHLR
jgi:hypothetical protein